MRMNIEHLPQCMQDSQRMSITKYLSENNTVTNVQNLPGVYAFWYKNDNGTLQSLSRRLKISSPNKKTSDPSANLQSMMWDWNMDKEYVCLYVGKSTDMQNRLRQHLLLGTPHNIYKKHANDIREKYKKYEKNWTQMLFKPKHNTTCQFRSGFDYLYKGKNIDIFDEIRARIYLQLEYVDDFVIRFYLEDCLIGTWLPWFNVDSER